MAVKKFIAAAIFAALILSAGRQSQARQSCNLTQEDFDALKAVENDYATDYAQRTKDELAKRKELLGKVLQCAVSEAINLRSDLDNFSPDDPDMRKLQSQLSDQLLNAINYYQSLEPKIGDLGLQGSRDFAKDLMSWRAGNYNSVAKSVADFILWNQNQPLIRSAKDRVGNIGQTIGLLSIVGGEKIRALWQGAADDFKSAERWNETAKASLTSFGPPDESLSAIQSSLDALSKTYTGLLDTVAAINSALLKQ